MFFFPAAEYLVESGSNIKTIGDDRVHCCPKRINFVEDFRHKMCTCRPQPFAARSSNWVYGRHAAMKPTRLPPLRENLNIFHLQGKFHFWRSPTDRYRPLTTGRFERVQVVRSPITFRPIRLFIQHFPISSPNTTLYFNLRH